MAKFTQHKILNEMLIGTKDAMLVESSPRDYYWGAGWHMKEWIEGWHNDETHWKGENQMGISLMHIRDLLSMS